MSQQAQFCSTDVLYYKLFLVLSLTRGVDTLLPTAFAQVVVEGNKVFFQSPFLQRKQPQ